MKIINTNIYRWKTTIVSLVISSIFLTVAFHFWPMTERGRAIRMIEQVGLTVDYDRVTTLHTDLIWGGWAQSGSSIASLDPISSALHILNPRAISLMSCKALENVNGLRSLTALEELDLSGCTALQNIDGLAGLVSLKVLILGSSPALQNMDGIKRLHLINLAVSQVNVNQNVDFLQTLPELQNLGLIRFNIETAKAIHGLKALVRIELADCENLVNLDGLNGLDNLKFVEIKACPLLSNIDGLTELPALAEMQIEDCNSLRNLNGIRELTSLKSLWIQNCSTLQNLDGIKGITSLESLRLVNCKALSNLEVVKGLINLRHLDLAASTNIPKANWPALKSVLKHTEITFPDGSRYQPITFPDGSLYKDM